VVVLPVLNKRNSIKVLTWSIWLSGINDKSLAISMRFIADEFIFFSGFLCLTIIGSRPLVGYYLEFEVAMINKYLKPLLGISLPNEQIEVSGIYSDYKQNLFNPIEVDLRFDAIDADLDLPILGKHDAFNDANMTAMMYVKLQNMKKMRT